MIFFTLLADIREVYLLVLYCELRFLAFSTTDLATLKSTGWK